MRYHIFNIGKPYTDRWWARNRNMGVITAGFDGLPNDRGDIILNDMAQGDWIVAYANTHGFVGAGIVAGPETYRLLSTSELPPEYESTHRHLRNITWIHTVVHLNEAVTLSQAGRQAPRQTKEQIHNHKDAERLMMLLAARSHMVEVSFPEELPIGTSYYEGAVQQVLVDRYERNPEARRDCVAHWGTKCAVCDFDFACKYGALGAGYIHVHHLRLISAEKKEHAVDPVADLRPVCPNCHAMLHRSTPPLSIATLRQLLQDGA